MLLFKPEHVPMILSGEKTVTRRFWKTRRAVPGSLHQARLKLFGKPFAKLRITEVYQEKVGDIQNEDVKAEGYSTLHDYFKTLFEINHKGRNWPEPFKTVGGIHAKFLASLVWVVRFTLEEVCDE